MEVVYAGFWRRAAAVLLDSLILTVFNGLLGTIFTLGGDNMLNIGQIITSFLSIVYYVYFIGNRGQTLGKMIMKIKVIGLETQKPIGYLKAFLRDIIGKILSGLVFGLGYLWSIRDKYKQTWHDKLAKSVVVRV
ncbi:RDD family protein [Candidatus Amesbacteria bacterium]|nr:RDD family protein [Candidatus Amesbacteria bacterium]